jgi:hypothetical protein
MSTTQTLLAASSRSRAVSADTRLRASASNPLWQRETHRANRLRRRLRDGYEDPIRRDAAIRRDPWAAPAAGNNLPAASRPPANNRPTSPTPTRRQDPTKAGR